MIAIIDYGAGNVASVANAVRKLGCNYIITSGIDELKKADKIILPGVGEASFAMKQLEQRNLTSFIKETKKPLLGICLGMQLLLDFSEEGETKELGI
ncbi:MAG: imidazole glycerol phosphate synthase subunit HisH, partial [Methanococcaceae archaeon]